MSTVDIYKKINSENTYNSKSLSGSNSMASLYKNARTQVEDTSSDVASYSVDDSSMSKAEKVTTALSIATTAATLGTSILGVVNAIKGSNEGSSSTGTSSPTASAEVAYNNFTTDASKKNAKKLSREINLLETSTLASVDNEITGLNSQKVALQAKISEAGLENRKAELAAQINTLSASQDTSQKRIDDLGKAIDNKNDENEGLQQNSNTIQDSIDKAVKADAVNGQRLTEAEKAKAGFENDIKTADSNIAEYSLQQSNAETSLTKLKGKLSGLRSNHGKSVTVTQPDGSSVKQRIDNSADIAEVEKQIEDQKEIIKTAKKGIREAEKTKKDATTKLELKNKEIDDIKSQITSGDTNVKELSDKKAEIDAQIASNNKIINSYNEEIQKEEINIGNVKNEIADLEAQKDDSSLYEQNINAQIAEIDKKIEAKKLEKENIQAMIDKAKTALGTAQTSTTSATTTASTDKKQESVVPSAADLHEMELQLPHQQK